MNALEAMVAPPVTPELAVADPVSETPRTDALDANTNNMREVMPRLWEHARDLERENAALREQVAKLEKAIKDSLPELEWYAKRKKNLAETTDTGGTWADLLDEDLDALRAVLDAAKDQP